MAGRGSAQVVERAPAGVAGDVAEVFLDAQQLVVLGDAVAAAHRAGLDQRAANDEARERNARLSAEVNDLVEGLEMVEERARLDLGMIKPDEILVQVTARR